MLRYLKLENVGPADELELDFAPRVNVLTGDNGLGKSFVLDCVWFLTSGHWVGDMALPTGEAPARISGKMAEKPYGSSLSSHEFDKRAQSWNVGHGWLPSTLTLYVRVDGTYAVNAAYRVHTGSPFLSGLITFDQRELWDGKAGDDTKARRSTLICRGIVEDWRSWQKEGDPRFGVFKAVLRALSEPGEEIDVGEPRRIRVDDPRHIPFIKTSYGEIPITLASAGMKRILSLAYLLVWAWFEQVEHLQLIDWRPPNELRILFDEIELHLHPSWQRSVLPALLAAIKVLSPDLSVQIIATTHSPLVLASLEPTFDTEQDALFSFDVVGPTGDRKVVVERAPWERYGDVSDWLTSHVFDLGRARSIPAEKAMQSAVEAISDSTTGPDRIKEIDDDLRRALGETDPFWMRWRKVLDRQEGRG